MSIPEAIGAKTVVGQLTVDRSTTVGYVTAYGCDDLATQPNIADTRSDLNFDGGLTPAASNRLIVQADADGDVCFRTTAAADMIIDVNAVAGAGITSFPNQRTDTRTGTTTIELPGVGEVPVWPPYTPLPAVAGTAALTGLPAGPDVTSRPITAVKIDNYRLARPQYGLELADTVIELNVEGVSRFVALFHTNLSEVGPVRSARTSDLDLLSAMNRPVFAYSGANVGVNAWIGSAASSGVLVDFSAQRNGCYRRTADRPGPHNLLFDVTCAVGLSPTAGPARPLWDIVAAWTPPAGTFVPDSTFTVPMDGVRVQWTWDPAAASTSDRRMASTTSPHPAHASRPATWSNSPSSTCRRPSTLVRRTRSPSGPAAASSIVADGRSRSRGPGRPPTTGSSSATPRPARRSPWTSAPRSSNSNASLDVLSTAVDMDLVNPELRRAYRFIPSVPVGNRWLVKLTRVAMPLMRPAEQPSGVRLQEISVGQPPTVCVCTRPTAVGPVRRCCGSTVVG